MGGRRGGFGGFGGFWEKSSFWALGARKGAGGFGGFLEGFGGFEFTWENLQEFGRIGLGGGAGICEKSRRAKFHDFWGRNLEVSI